MDTMLRVNHYMKRLAVKQNRKTLSGCFPNSSREAPNSQMPASDKFVPPSSLSSPLFKKEVDPSDFSPCIKQKTIINVQNSYFSKGNLKTAATCYVQNWFMPHEQRITSLVLVLLVPLCSPKFRMKRKPFCINHLSNKCYVLKNGNKIYFIKKYKLEAWVMW
jgi:hypothetical protein